MVFQEMVLTCLSFLCFYVVTYVYFGLISSSFIWGVLSFSSYLIKVNLQYHSERGEKKTLLEQAATVRVRGEEEETQQEKKTRKEGENILPYEENVHKQNCF